jgi:hypothetical protein
MRFKCGLTYPGGKSASVGFECDGLDHILDIVRPISQGVQCNGGPMVLTVHDTQEGSWITVQRRSCHGFPEMAEHALTALDPPYVPESMGRGA